MRKRRKEEKGGETERERERKEAMEVPNSVQGVTSAE